MFWVFLYSSILCIPEEPLHISTYVLYLFVLWDWPVCVFWTLTLFTLFVWLLCFWTFSQSTGLKTLFSDSVLLPGFFLICVCPPDLGRYKPPYLTAVSPIAIKACCCSLGTLVLTLWDRIKCNSHVSLKKRSPPTVTSGGPAPSRWVLRPGKQPFWAPGLCLPSDRDPGNK